MFKDKNDKLNLGPVWDFNLAFGNANYGNAWETYGLEINVNLGEDGWQNPFWWGIFMGDRYFTKELRCRWDDLSSNILSSEEIINTVDSLVNLLKEPSKRNFEAWPVLGVWVWPNYYVGNDYTSEINWLKDWINNRMGYLNNSIPGDCNEDPSTPPELSISTFPNPFSSKFNVQIMSDKIMRIRVELFSLNGNRLFFKDKSIVKGTNKIEINTDALSGGMYIYRVLYGDTELKIGKVVKR